MAAALEGGLRGAELAAAVPSGPVVLRNREGEPLVLCEARSAGAPLDDAA